MPLSDREHAVVDLLADGRTDASIAAELGVSVRTVAYMVSGLMKQYQVTNRFQLGLRLGAERARRPAPRPADEEHLND